MSGADSTNKKLAVSFKTIVCSRSAWAVVLSWILLFCLAAVGTGGEQDIAARTSGYHLAEVSRQQATEYRLYRDGHHFLTVVNESGTFNMRPRPGKDPNGWGSSLYLQPFLPGAELRHTTVEEMIAGKTGIRIRASGMVSGRTDATFGQWSLEISLAYDPEAPGVQGSGTYLVELPGELSGSTGDLNLYKLASNYLQDVPLLSGHRGNTGDMKAALISWEQCNHEWRPPETSSLLLDDLETSAVTVEVRGDHNRVDSAAQGYSRIEPASKPTLVVGLFSRQGEVPFGFFAEYAQEKKRDFWEDNVGMNLLVLEKSRQRFFNFEVTFRATSLSGDTVQ
ncbi:MAG: hypothetical protein K9K64_03310 [Desulfohalobiaceae bacterium]|nr:hypothetical protein [Desulfohalobiaceae bacterium]